MLPMHAATPLAREGSGGLACLRAYMRACVHACVPSMQMLEAEKRAILAMPAADLDDWEIKRMRAAARVQAHWRGYKARRKYAKSPERIKREQASISEAQPPTRPPAPMMGVGHAHAHATPPVPVPSHQPTQRATQALPHSMQHPPRPFLGRA